MGKLVRTKTPQGKAFDKLLKEADGIECRVGFFESAKYEDGTSVAYVAAIQEHGVPERSIPARPFMRPTASREKGNWDALLKNGARQVVEGKTGIQTVMETLGLIASGDVRKTISEVYDPPLSLATLLLRKHKKGGGTVSGKTVGQKVKESKSDTPPTVSGVSTKPLVDSSIMFNSVNYAVTRKGGK